MSRKMALNYFVCTLGEACPLPHPFRDVNHLIDTQANVNPDLPAVGSFVLSKDSCRNTLKPTILNFRDIRQHTLHAASILHAKTGVRVGEPVGLLCSSSLDFLVIWLACIRLGCPILLVAPECSASDIAQLCQSCKVSLLLVDSKHESLGIEGADRVTSGTLRCVRHPLDGSQLKEKSTSDPKPESLDVEIQSTDVAYWHHSSGTSSGIPKPIPQSHHGAVGALPCFDGRDTATFTTTPLYHGGPADLFRAWTSHALIWFFPSSDLPITAANVVRCLKTAQSLEQSQKIPAIRYFTAVPFILESMAEDPEGLELLKEMRLVGVGGASLSPDIGNSLVNHGVPLVSRYGSAECGFLLTSHREYDKDQDWQSLRLSQSTTELRFEEHEDSLSELIVPPNWPQLAKQNRDDGSYATQDLFSPHLSIANAWIYHSPAGARLTLSTGKKFDPTSIESVLRHDAAVEEALVFGSSKPYPGVLVFRSEKCRDESDENILRHIAPLIDKINMEGQDHAKIARHMIIPMPAEDRPIAKSSKGTVLRNRAERKYEREIERAYSGPGGLNLQLTKDEDVLASIQHIIEHIMPSKGPLSPQTDLVSYGVDSVSSIQIRKGLRQLLPSNNTRLPLNVVEDCGSMSALSQYILNLRRGEPPTTGTDDHAYMNHLVDKFSAFPSPFPTSNPSPDPSSKEETIILTGATGALGATLLSQLCTRPCPPRIYCLVRASSREHARERISSVLRDRQLPAVQFLPEGSVEALPSDLSSPSLGLDRETYARLSASTTAIVHLAWSVNFRMRLHSFEAHDLPGVQNLLAFARTSPRESAPRVEFCSSIASVGAAKMTSVPEEILDDPGAAAGVGYARSKWVAEKICERANGDARLRGRVGVYRVGQLAGHSETGVWNSKEAWPLMLSTARELGCLPELKGEELHWLPVDLAARAFAEGMGSEGGGREMRVFHVLNDNGLTTWDELVRWLAKWTGAEKVPPAEWLRILEAKAAEDWKHPAVHLLEHWKSTLLEGDQKNIPEFDMEKTKEEIPALRDINPVLEGYFEKLWNWIERNLDLTGVRLEGN